MKKKPDPTTVRSMGKIFETIHLNGIRFIEEVSTKGKKMGCIEIIDNKKNHLEKYFNLEGYVKIAKHSDEKNLLKEGYVKYSGEKMKTKFIIY